MYKYCQNFNRKEVELISIPIKILIIVYYSKNIEQDCGDKKSNKQ